MQWFKQFLFNEAFVFFLLKYNTLFGARERGVLSKQEERIEPGAGGKTKGFIFFL